jgi:hypothetical protein
LSFPITTTATTDPKADDMHMGHSPSVVKPERERLPNKRYCETRAGQHNGAALIVTAGFYPDGRIGELFITAGHVNSALDALASDAAIAISFALQHGADLAAITSAMKRNSQGEPSSPIGAALDLLTMEQGT